GVRGQAPWPRWNPLRAVALATVAWVYLAYFLSAKPPSAHAFYVLLPLSAILSVHAWARLWPRPGFRIAAKTLLVAGVGFPAALPASWASTRSLYWGRRIPPAAIALRDDRPPRPPPGSAAAGPGAPAAAPPPAH